MKPIVVYEGRLNQPSRRGSGFEPDEVRAVAVARPAGGVRLAVEVACTDAMGGRTWNELLGERESVLEQAVLSLARKVHPEAFAEEPAPPVDRPPVPYDLRRRSVDSRDFEENS